jgi:uncharacterized protein GlcG (DUF336 family)
MQDCEKPGEKNMLSRHRSLMAPLLGLLLLVLPHTLPAQLRDVKLLTLEAAKTMANAAEARARANGWTVAIAVVDASGDLLVFYRLDGTQLGSIDIAIGKARTAPRFRRPTKSLDDRIGAGRLGLLAVDDMLPLEGGVPITLGGTGDRRDRCERDGVEPGRPGGTCGRRRAAAVAYRSPDAIPGTSCKAFRISSSS